MEDIKRIALLGLPGSGKTWYIAALSRAFLRYATLFPEDFTISITNIEDFAPVIMSLEDMRQSPIQDYLWQLSWKNKKAHHTYTSHNHWLLLTDLSGLEYSKLGTKEESPSISETLTRADMILFFLDSSANGSQSDPSENKTLMELLRKLYTTLGDNKKDRQLGFCFSKYDIVSSGTPTMENDVFAMRNTGILDMINYANNIPGVSVKKFSLSSTGYRSDNTSNYDHRNNAIIDVDTWHPWRVEDPILWLTEKVEIDRLAKAGNRFAQLFFRKIRQKNFNKHSIYKVIQKIRSDHGSDKN